MLEAITDFWKPVKKASPPPKLKLTEMQVGSVVRFGYVPQVALSGNKLTVDAVNSYQFGKDVLTSFVLSNEKKDDVSMIVAEAQGEQYLAISRRISVEDQQKLFDLNTIKEITNNEEVTKFTCKDNVPELKGWLVTNYKREIKGMRGFIHKADFRDGNDGTHAGAEFEYTLLGSSSNEHAIEIESYVDGHVDVYATIYRRTNDISEVIHVDSLQQSDVQSETKSEDISLTAKKPLPPVLSSSSAADKASEIQVKPAEAESTESKVEEAKPEETKVEEVKLEAVEPIKAEPVKVEPVGIGLQNLPEMVATPLAEEIITSKAVTPELIKNDKEDNMNMSAISNNEPKLSATNGQSSVELTSAPRFGSSTKDFKQEVNGMGKIANGMDNESIECDLRVANQIIDEAIRNEMRLSDVVRRIIELPVSHQEVVQIPINLADEDYSLLAIRYGIPSSDRNAIKIRIIQDLGDFSGNKKINS
ncbi:MAG: hypothetical protein ABL857_06030 [Rickettsiales bacterium]|jgi:hypothetical protein